MYITKKFCSLCLNILTIFSFMFVLDFLRILANTNYFKPIHTSIPLIKKPIDSLTMEINRLMGMLIVNALIKDDYSNIYLSYQSQS